MYKKAILITISIFLLLTGSLIFLLKHNFNRSFHHKYTANTNLSSENMNGFYLYDNIHDEKFLKAYGRQNHKSFDHDVYNYYTIDNDIQIATNQQDEILHFSVANKDVPSSKGIKVGDSLKKVKAAYGKNFYKRSEQGVDILGYVDKRNHQFIEFWHYQDKVLFYTLDDNSMK